jgi:hypothetical protein
VTRTPTNTPTETATPSPTPCSICNSYIVSVTTTCNADGTLHWTAIVRNNGPCTVVASWTATLQLQRNSGTYRAVLTQSGTDSFPPGDSTVGGDFCYVWPAGTTGLRTQFGISGSSGTCASSYTSAPIWPCPVQPSCTVGFNDVPVSSPYYSAVTYLASAGIISGTPDGRFQPDQATSRAQAVAVLVRAFHLPLVSASAPRFRDVAPGDAGYAEIETAAAAGWLSGYEVGTFRPADPITREALAALVVKAARWPVSTPPAGHFKDVPPGNQFYASIETGTAHGIFDEAPDGMFRPEAKATRGELAQISYRASVPEEPGDPTTQPAAPTKPTDPSRP